MSKAVGLEQHSYDVDTPLAQIAGGPDPVVLVRGCYNDQGRISAKVGAFCRNDLGQGDVPVGADNGQGL